MSTTIRFEDERGRVRYQPVDENGDRLWANVLFEAWMSDPLILPPALYRSRNRADRIARRRNKRLARQRKREAAGFREASE